MSCEIVKFDDSGATFERDLKVVEALCAGNSVQEVARQEKMSVRAVESALIRISGGASPAIRERHLLLLHEQMMRLHKPHYQKALECDYDSSVIVMRIADFTARLLGLYAPVGTPPPEPSNEVETTTEELERVMDRVLGDTSRTIEGEATPVEDSNG